MSKTLVLFYSVVSQGLAKSLTYGKEVIYGDPLGPLAISSLAFLFKNKKARLEIARGRGYSRG